MPQYLYRILPTRHEMLAEGLTDHEADAMRAHFAYLERLRDAGTLILAGRTQNTDPSSFGLAIFNAGSDAEAEEIVRSDPAVARGVMRSELYPYRVALIREANVQES